MALFTVEVTNRERSGVRRGGYYFPPLVEDKEVEITNYQLAEIAGCESLVYSITSTDDTFADISTILPDGLNSFSASVDSTDETSGLHEGVYSGGGGSTTDRTDDEKVSAAPAARKYAENNGVTVQEVYDSGKATGAGGRVLKSDVEAYLEEQTASDDSDSTEDGEADDGE